MDVSPPDRSALIVDRLAAISSLARYAADGRLPAEVVADAIGRHTAAIAELVAA